MPLPQLKKSIATFSIPLLLALPASALLAHAIDIDTTSESSKQADSGMDKSVAPGDDFYRYINGGWAASAVIPNDKSAVGVTSTLRDQSDAAVLQIIEQSAQAPAGSPARKVGDYYAAYLNTDAINQRGLDPIKPQLAAIDNLHDKAGLATYLGQHLRADVDPLNATNFFTENLFGLWVAQGFHDHSKYTGYLLQGGLGLPDREYYLSSSPKMDTIRVQYLAHITALFKLANVANPDQAAKRVFDLEMQIAQGHVKRADSADMDKADNTWRKADFAKKAPGLNWNAYFAGAGLAKQSSFIVWHPSAFKNTSALVASTPVSYTHLTLPTIYSV